MFTSELQHNYVVICLLAEMARHYLFTCVMVEEELHIFLSLSTLCSDQQSPMSSMLGVIAEGDNGGDGASSSGREEALVCTCPEDRGKVFTSGG